MLEGKALAAAIQRAIELRNKRNPGEHYGPSALARDLGIKQPSASQLTRTGRLAKSRLPLLWRAFEGVVGPQHWGLPQTTWASVHLAAHEPAAPYLGPSKLDARLASAVASLSDAAKRQVLGYVTAIADDDRALEDLNEKRRSVGRS